MNDTIVYKATLVFHHDEIKGFLNLHFGSFALITVFLILSAPSTAQELEPRSLTNVPIGTNFAVLGYGFASGNILFDPALPLEDVNARNHSIVGAYIRSVNFFGMGGKVNMILPFAAGDWEGLYQGNYTTAARTGLGDLRFGFSFNFVGSPALDQEDYRQFEQRTIAGFSLQVVAPTGQYFEDRFINLGSNRWAFRPQLGASHRIQNWYIEYALNAWLYTINHAFNNGNTLRQNPIGTFKIHVIRAFNRGIWACFGAGYALGGRSFVNDVRRDASISVIRLGTILVVPVNPRHSLKLTLLTSRRFAEGADFDAISLTYQFIWN